MKRNPFCKSDFGATFICFMTLFGLAQLLFVHYVVSIVYLTEDSTFVKMLIETSIENGFEYIESEDKFKPAVPN